MMKISVKKSQTGEFLIFKSYLISLSIIISSFEYRIILSSERKMMKVLTLSFFFLPSLPGFFFYFLFFYNFYTDKKKPNSQHISFFSAIVLVDSNSREAAKMTAEVPTFESLHWEFAAIMWKP